MDQTQLVRFEELCKNYYSGTSEGLRKEAHSILTPSLSDVGTIPQLEFVLANSRNAHALIFASNGLMQLITEFWAAFSESQREVLKSFILGYLSRHCAEMYADSLGDQAMSFMIRLLCRLIKLSWLEGPKYQTVTGDVKNLIDSGSTPQAILAVDIYTALASEMQPVRGPQMARWRRTAMSFRDVSLASIFQTGMKILQNLFQGKLNVADQNEESRLVHKVLKLVVASLSFDFMGTVPDETADDQSTVMVPYTWTNVKDLSYPSLFFDLYSTCVSAGRKQCAILSLQCLVLFASLRKSLYSKEEERAAMLSSYMRGTSRILTGSLGLDAPECYHEFCRLIGRINAANQLADLVSNPQFSLWIDQVMAFTSSALKRVGHLPNSMHYLLTFWATLVPSVATRGGPPLVKQYLEEVLVGYIENRLQLAASSDEEETDPLEDETLLQEQLEVVTTLSRLHVNRAFEILSFQNFTQKQLVWKVYLLGALMAGQVDNMVHKPVVPRRSNSMDSHPMLADDQTSPSGVLGYTVVGGIVKHVFTLMAAADPSNEALELSYLYFLDQFKKVYLSEQARVTTLVTPRQGEISNLALCIGLSNDEGLLDLFVSKIFTNFQKHAALEQILKKTLAFFSDLASASTIVYMGGHSVSMGEALLGNEKIKLAITLPIDFNRLDKNFNSIYFSVIFRLIFASPNSQSNLWQYFDSLFEAITLAGVGTKSSDQGKRIITLARNLKGVSLAANSSESYKILFKYLVKTPNVSKLSLFSAAADVWWDEPQVVVPVLKFIAHFAQNKGQRIAFEANSPNGIILFREAVKVLSAYGQRMLTRSQAHVYRDIYEEKYKGIGAALSLLTNTLGGGYANLSVFELYGDTSLSVSMETALKLCLSIPLNDLAAYLKSLKSVYSFLDLATKSHMSALLALGPEQVAQVLKALEDGLVAFDTAVALNCCVTIDNICTYLLQPNDSSEESRSIQSILDNGIIKSSLTRIMTLMNHLSTSGEFASTWSLSRPFLGLILICKTEYLGLRTSIIAQQPNPERTRHVEKCYDELMKGVSEDLMTKNRETFTKNLYQFGINVRNS